MNIYVGNVSYAATEKDLEELFKKHGEVTKAEIKYLSDGRSRGFGFVEMPIEDEAKTAIAALASYELMGRPLKVNPARPRQQPARQPQQQPKQLQTTPPKIQIKSTDRFHNPYTFVPTPPRDNIIGQDIFAADFDPLKKELNHATLQDNLWSGHIPIKLTAVTPLVLLKSDDRDEDTSDEPYDVHSRIPESSLRGMLRSAYETITNSRYSSFRNKDRLAYRMDTREATKLIPTVIKKDTKTKELKACFYTGTSYPTKSGARKTRTQRGNRPTLHQMKEGAMYAALLSRYNKSKITYHGTTDEPKSGDEVYAELILCGSGTYLYWQTSRLWLKSKCPSIPASGSVPHSWDANKLHKGLNGNPIIEVVEGTVLITNQNIDKKGNERIFFYHNTKPQQEIVLNDDHKKDWTALIKNYRDTHHDDDIFKREDMYGISKKPWDVAQKSDDNTEDAWSPHLYHKGNNVDRWGRSVDDALKLKEDDMVYARCRIDDKTGDIKAIEKLFPVMISRELYNNTPEQLLATSLHPAKNLNELSPADRLFGWTPQGESSDSGYKSRIRIVCDHVEQTDSLNSFENKPLSLGILGTPKPEQGRFYVAKDEKGTPQDEISKQDAGYDKDSKKHLRGRKHFWHHKDLETVNDPDYWDPDGEERTREYIYNGDKSGQQNRIINAWIKPDTTFHASLYVQNLQQAEIGALLWLFTLPKECYFRLGYGKPLGFGSVKVEIDMENEKGQLPNNCLPVGLGSDWKAYYTKLEETPPAKMNEAKREECIKVFKDSMVEAYSPKQENGAEDDSTKKTLSNLSMADQLKRTLEQTSEGKAMLDETQFDKLPFIRGFLQVLKGPGTNYPIHYPRGDREPHEKGKNYEWFMENERGNKYRDGKQLALPGVNNDQGLPYKPSDPKPKRR